MTLAKVCRLLSLTICLVFLVLSQLVAQLAEPTPDPYFKPPAKKPDFSENYVPPSFSPGSIGIKRIPKSSSNESVPWNHQRSIVRERNTESNSVSNGIVDTPDKIQLVSGAEPVAQQEGVRVASLPKTKVEPLKHFEPGRVVAIVGGEPIFVGDMLFEANQIIEAKIPTAPESAKEVQRKRLLKALTRKFVDQKLLYVDAMSKIPADADMDDMLKRASTVFNEHVLPGLMEKSKVESVTVFDANLRVLGSSLRQYRANWARDQLARQFTQESLNVDDTVTHQEMLEDYLSNKEKYAQRARSRWEQIMVRFDKHSSRKEAKKKIAELGNKIIYGASLAEIAKEHSDGFRASKGGRHEWTGKGALVLKEIDKAIFELPVNELSDIIESRDGFHIVRVLERTDATYTPFTEAQMEIRKRLKNEKVNGAFEEHLAALRTNIPVEYFDLD